MISLALRLAAAALAPLALAIPAPALCQAAPAEERLAHISVVTLGDAGPPVILIPGLASPRAVWDGVAPELAKAHRVYLVQVNGFGGDAAGDNDKPGLLDAITADLAGYIATHKIAQPAIVGHSMGGMLAMMLATRHPEAVGRVMVVDALPFFSLLFGPSATAEGARPFAEQARARTLATPPAAAPVTIDPGGIWSNRADGRIRVANWSAKADPKVSGQAIYEMMTTDWRPELSKLRARPFTILYATGAGPEATAIFEGAYAGSPATLVPVADSWHFIMLDQPAAFATALNRFLSAP